MTPDEAALRILDVTHRVDAESAVSAIVRAAQEAAVREYAQKVRGLVSAVKELLGDVEENRDGR